MNIPVIQLLCEISPVAAIVTDADDIILFFNPSALQTVPGLKEGTRFESYVLLEENTVDPPPYTFNSDERVLLLKGKSGAVITAVIRKNFGKENKVIFIRDISEQADYVNKVNAQQQTEIELSRSKNILEGNLEEALKEIALRSSQTMHVSRVNIWKIDSTFSSITSLINYDSRRGGFLDNITLFKHQFPKYFSLMQTEEIIPTSEALNDPKAAELKERYLIPYGIRSLMDVPVRIEGKMKGVICFEDTENIRRWDVTDQNFALAIAQHIAQAIVTSERNNSRENLEKALAEKKLLLAEINQRVKNNFSLIAEILRMQEGKADDEKSKSLFAEIRARITSMAMIHRQLYMSENLNAVNFRDFLLDLSAHFRSGFSSEGIEISTMLDNCQLPLSKALLSGLVVNEVLTNFSKSSMIKQGTHNLFIQMNCFSERVRLKFTADGGDQKFLFSDGLASELISELISRLNGTLESANTKANDLILSFSMN